MLSSDKKKEVLRIDNNIAPKKPDQVLFGLIDLINYGPFNIFPKIYPPESDDIVIIKTKAKIKFNSNSLR